MGKQQEVGVGGRQSIRELPYYLKIKDSRILMKSYTLPYKFDLFESMFENSALVGSSSSNSLG